MRVLVLALIAACGAKPTPSREAAPLPLVHAPTDGAAAIVVLRSSGAVSRQPISPRILRRILGARRGEVEVEELQVSLAVEEVISGPLDREYAKRPIGANHLPVILVDEAAHAVGQSLAGFAGTWRLTRLDDGTFVASAIEDTPFPRDLVEKRRAMLAKTKRHLRSENPEARIAGLNVLQRFRFYELAPDVIPLLDDEREGIHFGAHAALHQLALPLADPAAPQSPSRDDWTAYWSGITTGAASPPTIVPTTRATIASLAMPQSWPNVVALPDGAFAIGVNKLDTPIDGVYEGVGIARDGKWSWVTKEYGEAVDAAGAAVVYAARDGKWHVVVRDVVPPKSTVLSTKTAHGVLAAYDKGFVFVGIANPPSLFAQAIDATGKLAGKQRSITLPTTPMHGYHRGVYPVAVARKRGGWIVVFEAIDGVFLANLDDKLALVGSIRLSGVTGMAQPKVVTAGDRAFVVWYEAGALKTVALDRGRVVAMPVTTGSEVRNHSKPVALDDGFALAWIESNVDELHVGRWDREGTRVADVVIQAREAAPHALSLVRDGDALVVAYEDTTRYPYELVARRLAISALR